MANAPQTHEELHENDQDKREGDKQEVFTEGGYAKDKLKTDLIKLAGAKSVSQRTKAAP